mgnify:CR=1 FL=1
MFTRRTFLKGIGAVVLGGVSLGAYAVAGEPSRLVTRTYSITPARWPNGFRLRIAVLADIHACHPWMPPERIRSICDRTNALSPDITLLLGDYCTGQKGISGEVSVEEWSEALSGLSAPLGVHAVLGNHDWWEDEAAQQRGHGPIVSQTALENVGVKVYENHAMRLEKDGHPFWLAGLGDQVALTPRYGRSRWIGVDDLGATLAMVTDEAPVILMAHEPDIFPQAPERVSLTLSGHTHGGQVRLFGYSPYVPSRYSDRYAYGHIVETRPGASNIRPATPRDLIVSGGLGCSILPVRFGVPPEIVMVEIG